MKTAENYKIWDSLFRFGSLGYSQGQPKLTYAQPIWRGVFPRSIEHVIRLLRCADTALAAKRFVRHELHGWRWGTAALHTNQQQPGL